MRSAFGQMRAHLTNFVRIWSLLVGLTKCAAHLGKCARVWPTAQIGQMRLTFRPGRQRQRSITQTGSKNAPDSRGCSQLGTRSTCSQSSKHLFLDLMVLCKCFFFVKIILNSRYLVEGLAWWDCPLTGGLTNYCPSVLCHCWLGHLTGKNLPQYDL